MNPHELAALLNRRKAYFVMDAERDEKGDIIPCIAIEKEPGYFKTDWAWGKSLTEALKIAEKMNAKLGITKEDADKIVMSTMRIPTFH
jgi:hypothetical protein